MGRPRDSRASDFRLRTRATRGRGTQRFRRQAGSALPQQRPERRPPWPAQRPSRLPRMPVASAGDRRRADRRPAARAAGASRCAGQGIRWEGRPRYSHFRASREGRIRSCRTPPCAEERRPEGVRRMPAYRRDRPASHRVYKAERTLAVPEDEGCRRTACRLGDARESPVRKTLTASLGRLRRLEPVTYLLASSARLAGVLPRPAFVCV